MNEYESLVYLTASDQLILIGENHGVTENALFVRSLVDQYLRSGHKIKFVGLEYPSFIHSAFINNVENDNYTELVSSERGQILLNDGRFSESHFSLLKYLQDKNISIVFFDSGTASWDERDRLMAQNLNPYVDSLKPDEKAIVIAGNIHTNISKMIVNNRSYIPMGSYINTEKLRLILLKYHKGEFFNFGRKSFSEVPISENLVEEIDSQTIHFHISQATPTQ